MLTLLRGGLAPDEELLRAGYAELDRDGNGVVSFEELFCWSPVIFAKFCKFLAGSFSAVSKGNFAIK